MEIKEAIIRIKDHIRVHKIGQPPHILIGEALALALNALQKEDKKRAVVISDKLICCPRCRSGEYTTNEQGKKNEYCGLCGQHLEHKENSCVRCGAIGEIVHHKIHLSPENIDNPDISLSEDNLELLCRDCYATKQLMREILFRGKRKDNGEWVYGFYCYNPLMKRAEIFSFDETRSYVYEVIPETVGQFTGLTDKNGKKIFEGDILEGLCGLHKAYFDAGFVCFDWENINGKPKESFSGFADDYEIIGNIHDNPEFLEVTK